jgi:hypothetical protein
MDKATGKMLNYRQLLRHPEYSADWQLSSANEFGRLAKWCRRPRERHKYNKIHQEKRHPA